MEIVIHKTNYSQDEQRGTVQDVIFTDIAVTSSRPPPSSFRGIDAEHGVGGVTIANLRFNGQPVRSAPEARLQIGPHVSDVQFKDTAGPPKHH
jgi:hypothetical protein